jgi:PAS domain S-box-containing protein
LFTYQAPESADRYRYTPGLHIIGSPSHPTPVIVEVVHDSPAELTVSGVAMEKHIATALKVSGAYVAAATVWIALSDMVLSSITPDLKHYAMLEIIKELVFVLVTGTVLWVIVRRWSSRMYHELALRERMRSALQENKERYRALFENSFDGILLSAVDGRVIAANNAACGMLGGSEKDLRDMGQPEFVDHSDPRSFTLLEERQRTGRATGEIRCLRTDGTSFPAEVSSMLFRGEGNEILTSMVIHDISARKVVEHALRVSEERYRSLFLSISEEVHYWKLIYGPRGEIVSWRLEDVNPAALTTWAQQREDVLGKTPDEIFGPGTTERLMPLVNKIMSGGMPGEIEDYSKNLDKFFRFTSVPMHDHFLTTGADLTSLKNVQLELGEAQHIARLGSWRWDATTDAVTGSNELFSLYGLVAGRDDMPHWRSQRTVNFSAPDWERLNASFLETVHTGVGRKLDLQLIRNGTPLWVTFRTEATTDQSGSAVGVHGTIQDVNEQKLSELKVRESARRFREMLEGIDLIALILDRNGRVSFCNDHVLRLTGWKREEIMGVNWFSKFVPDSHPEALRLFEESMRARGLPLHFENPIKTRDNHFRLIRWTNIVLRDEKGVTEGTASIGEDITEIRFAEELVLKERDFSKSVIDSLPGIFFMCNDRLELLRWNSNCEELTGHPAGGMVRLSLLELFGEGDRAFLNANVREAFGKGVFDCEVNLVGRNGKRTPYYLTGKRISIEESACLVGFGVDITVRRQAEEQAQRSAERLRALSRHLQIVRESERTAIAREIHDELGQSLTAIRLDLSWIAQQIPDTELVAHERCAAAEALVDDTVAAVQRISSELRPGMLDELGLAAAIEWQGREFQRRAGILCDVRGVEEVEVPDRRVATALFRIFQETLTNVARHAHATAVVVTLAAESGEIIMKITDNGKGIPEGNLEAPSSIGLLGMRERAIAVGGSLSFAGGPGHGTSITVHIPAQGAQS